jgi:hypothetical protein
MDCKVVGANPINLPSIMSYDYQLRGVRTNMLCQGIAPEIVNLFKEMDYSHGRLCPLNESQLDERWGMGLVAVDFDCDGVVESGLISPDLKPVADNSWCTATTGLQTLSDYNEWANISDNAAVFTKSQLENLPEISCVEIENWEEQSKRVGDCAIPALTVEPCVSREIYFAIPTASPFEFGICLLPYEGVLSAQDKMPAGSVLYLKYGTYSETGSTVLLNKRMILTASSTAVIRPASPVSRQPSPSGSSEE